MKILPLAWCTRKRLNKEIVSKKNKINWCLDLIVKSKHHRLEPKVHFKLLEIDIDVNILCDKALRIRL